MKIIMMRPTYKPELSGGTHLAADLVEDLLKAGHEIELITPVSAKFTGEIDTDKDECRIHRIKSRFNRRDVLSRILRYIDVSLKMYKTARKINDADLIMTHSMPPLCGPLGALLGRKKKLPVVYWEQDIVSESLISTAILGKPGIKQKLGHWVATKLERYSETHSSHIITISQQFKKMHTDRGIDEKKVSVVYNWIDIDQVYPVERKDNVLFDELGIDRNKFIVSYCGNLGVPQNVEIMIDAAEKLKDVEGLQFVIIGGGSREEKIRKYVSEKELPNLSLYPLQPLERSHLVYSVGDVGLVIGRRGTSRNGFPSKTWSIMSSGEAMISCFDEESELSQFVREGSCGIAISPDSSEQLAEAVMKLFRKPEEAKVMGANGRRYVSENFSRKAATSQIIKILEDAHR